MRNKTFRNKSKVYQKGLSEGTPLRRAFLNSAQEHDVKSMM